MREARLADAPVLRRWRNDPDAVRYSGTRREVTLGEHSAWLRYYLADRDTHIWIGEVGHRPVGQVRIDLASGRGHVHIAVDATARGQGYGAQLLRYALDRALADGLDEVIAHVHPANMASLRLFTACRFRRSGRRGPLLRLSWKPQPSSAAGLP